MAVAYLATFILGAASGAIHPVCYAYIGALLPLVFAFIYLYTCSIIRGFGAATALNGFIFVLFLIAGEADPGYMIATVVITALAVALGGGLIYLLDRRILKRSGFDAAQAGRSARWLALVTAPYLFLFPSGILYR